MEKNDPYLDRIKELIEESLGWGDSKDWSNADFGELSEKIWTKAGTKLSLSTLKRIWGKVRYESSPTAATLNCLAAYLDFADWRAFKKAEAAPPPMPPTSEAPSPPRPVPTANRSLLLMAAAIAAVFATYGVIALFTGGRQPATNTAANPRPDKPIIFTSHTTTADLPNSVVFDYDATGYHPDSLFIQQSWDPTRRESVPTDGKQHTSIYFYPGFFKAKLIVNNKVVRESPVFIKTTGWKGIVDGKPTPIYLSDKEMMGQGFMGISESLMEKKTGSSVLNNTWATFLNVRTFDGLKGNDFSLDVTLRNSSPVEASLCRKVVIKVLGTVSAVIIPMSTKGCIADLILWTGGRWIDGKNTDLSAFGCDFSQWQHLTCIEREGHLLIRLGDRVALDTPEAHSIGDIIGLRIEFEGAGQIKDVLLKGAGKTAYESHF